MHMKHFGFVFAALCGAAFFAHAQDTTSTVSAMTGVYTQAQADEGVKVYHASCDEGCHLYRLEGYGRAKPLKGDGFKQDWKGKTLAELFQFISVKMPQDFPATLTPEEYVNVMAYVLSQNGFPAGTKPLTGDATALAGIVFADE